MSLHDIVGKVYGRIMTDHQRGISEPTVSKVYGGIRMEEVYRLYIYTLVDCAGRPRKREKENVDHLYKKERGFDKGNREGLRKV